MIDFNRVMYRLIRFFFLALGAIPRHLAFSLAGAMGALWYALDKRHRNLAMDNLTRAFGNEKQIREIKRIARNAFNNIALIPFEVGGSLRLKESDLIRYCQISGLENLRNAHAKGKGVLLLGGHLGNWELFPTAIRALGYSMSFVYRPLDFVPMDRFFYHYRCRFGNVPIAKKKAMRKVLRPLRDGTCVGLLMDQDSGLTAGVFADFFGRPACTNKGMALLALKTKAAVVPAYLVRRKMSYRIWFGPQIPLIETGNKEQDIAENTRNYNMALETMIRQYPEQWLWVHNRWRNQPPKDRPGQ